MNRAYNSNNAYKYDNYYMNTPQRRDVYGKSAVPTRYYDNRYSRKAELEKRKQNAYKKALKIERIIGVTFRVAVIFFALSFLVYRYVLITELNMTANNLKAEYTALVAENQGIQNEIDSAVDLKKLQEIAATRLGMVRPSSDQIIYIENNLGDHGERVDKKKEAEKAEQTAAKAEESAISGVPGSIVRFVTGK